MASTKKSVPPPPAAPPPPVQPRPIELEMQESYLDYAMSVIIARALPDVRDGLKPVHRRVLYAMWTIGLRAAAKFRKSATIVGECLGKYHPHGDIAVYDSLVRMAQDFSLRYPLVAGQGNFGSMDGDSAAAMRYCVTGDTLVVTEHGLLPIGELADQEDIQLKILSQDRKVNQAVKWFDSGLHPTVKITTHKGYSVQGSLNHPLLTYTKGRFGRPMFQWKTLGTMTVGEVAVLDRSSALWPTDPVDLLPFVPPMKNKRSQKKILPHYLDQDLAFILGSLCSEGTIGAKEIEFCNTDENWISDFASRWQKVFPDTRLHKFRRAPSSYGKRNYWQVEIHSQYVIEFLRNLGLQPVTSPHRQIPKLILGSPQPVVASFLQSYFEGDGSISSSDTMIELSCCSMSETLIEELQIVLLRFGIDSFKRFDRWRNIHKLYLRGYHNYIKFSQAIGFRYKKNQKLQEIISQLRVQNTKTDYVPFISSSIRSTVAAGGGSPFVMKHNFDRYDKMAKNYPQVCTILLAKTKVDVQPVFTSLLANQYLFEPIVKVQKTGIQRVYSLKVASPCHSFIGNGFINHNTEAKLAGIAEELLLDIEKETVRFTPNYDGAHQEPTVLPGRLPNLILNGSTGIAVGMATNIPPHNLTEICDAIIHLADHPDATVDDLMRFVHGPDFPTGGTIFDTREIKQAYATGKGAIVTRAKAEIVEHGSGHSIVVTEIPYLVNKALLLEKIAELVKDKRIDGIRDLRDESSERGGLRVVIELKKDAYPRKVLNQLFQHTQLQETYHVNLLALVDGIQPRVLTLKAILEEYLKHRREVIKRRTAYDLARAVERAHILEGLQLALAKIDEIIATIKKSQDKDEAKGNLVKRFKLSERQAVAILEMRLQQLANLERLQIEQELKAKRALIQELQAILKSATRITGLIKDDCLALKDKSGDARRTQVVSHGVKEFTQEDLIPDEDVIIALTRNGYIKALPPEAFHTQERGGKGVIGLATKEEDNVAHFFSTTTHANILFFTSSGRVFQLQAYEIPKASRQSRGTAIVNFLQLGPNERISAALPRPDQDEAKFLVMVTTKAQIMKVAIADFSNVRQSGLIAIRLRQDDELEWVKPSNGADTILLATAHGQSIRFPEKQLRPMGRGASGVRGIRLKAGDAVVGMDVIDPAMVNIGQLLTVMAHGFGKRSSLKAYKTQGRGGMGIKTAKITAKTGPIVSALVVNSQAHDADLIIISAKGQVIRLPLNSVSVLSRATQGVRLMRFKEDGDRVASVTML